MSLEQPTPTDAEQTLAWRERLSLRLLRGFFLTFAAGSVVVGAGMHGDKGRTTLLMLALVSSLVLAYPAITGRPGGAVRSWLIVLPGIAVALAGYASVGYLSGPAVVLSVVLMLAGLLLGHRTMFALTGFSALAVGAIGWAMVGGHIPAPDPMDVSMTNASGWLRSIGLSFIGIGFFGGMMVAVVGRIERSLALAERETSRREHAERARAEAEIQALEAKQLETVGRLAAGVAHDFNNNLTAILGSAELLRLELDPNDDKHALVAGIVQASSRAAELTSQLLQYSRRAQMIQASVDLHRAVEEAVKLIRRSVDPRIEIVTKLLARPAIVSADATLVQGALLNLLVNGCEAMPEGGTLTVATSSIDGASSEQGSTNKQRIALDVRDTGGGIPKEHLRDIFNPFFTTKPVGRGTGLGLASVAGTIRAHGGLIEVESEVGVGTVFHIELPLSEESAPVSPPRAASIAPGKGEILLVDDDAMVARTAVAALTSFGYAVTRVPEGASAVATVTKEPKRYDLVLLDLRMPGMSGEATFDALRAIAPGLRVLIWSGYGAEQDVNSMLKRGAVGFVQKPYRVAELSHAIADALQTPVTLR